MADQQLGINQGDHIYYYDLSTGGVTREWFFQGGTPTGGTGYGPDVRYYGVNYTGYSTGLVVTGAGGITAAAYKPNIIIVYPEYFEPGVEVTYGLSEVSESPMSRTLTYSAGGSASSGYSSYSWIIPELGATSGSLLSSVNYACTDWFTLTGTYSGAPDSSHLSTVVLDLVTTAGSEASLTYDFNFKKIGVEEQVNYWSPGTYATAGKYYNATILPQRTSDVGLGGSDCFIFKFDFSLYSPRWDNTSFHSTKEAVYFYPNSPDVSKTYSAIKMNIILDGAALVSAGATGGYSSLDRYILGNYMIPGDVSSQFGNKFYSSDNFSTGTLTGLVDGLRKWSGSSLENFLNNQYYLSGSSKFIELGGYLKVLVGEEDPFGGGTFIRPPAADLASVIGYKNSYLSYAWDGGFGAEDGYAEPAESYHGICIPSGIMLEEQYGASDVDVDIRLTLYDSVGSIITDFQFVVSAFSTYGNSPDLYLITVDDTSYGNLSGIVTLINTEIAAQPGGLDKNIIFESIYYLSPYQDGGAEGLYSTGSFFGGIKMSIKDPRTSSTYSNRYIHSLEIQWGSQMSDFISDGILDGIEFPTIPLASPITNSGSAMASWTGLPSKITVPTSSYSNYFRGWKIGGSL